MRRLELGLSLIELLLAAALSGALTLALIPLIVHSRQLSDTLAQQSRALESTAGVQHLLRYALRDALYQPANCVLSTQAGDSDGASASTSDSECLPPVMAWSTGIDGSAVLQLNFFCCREYMMEQFYLARRGGRASNPLSLYRRRQAVDGRFEAGVELVEGVQSFSVQILARRSHAYQHIDQVVDWNDIRALRISYNIPSLAMDSFTFTLSRRFEPGAE